MSQVISLIQEVEMNEIINKLAKKNGWKIQIDGFGGGIGDSSDLVTFHDFEGITIDVIYNEEQYGGTTVTVNLQDENGESFAIQEGKSIVSAFSFIKKLNGNFDQIIAKHIKKLKKQRDAEFKEFMKSSKRKY